LIQKKYLQGLLATPFLGDTATCNLTPCYRHTPRVHPEDFVTFKILQKQPHRGTYREWGEVAGVLAHMIGGRRSLVNELTVIINRIQRLDRSDPMRATKEQELVNVLLCERRRLAVPLGEAALPQLEAPGGPLGRAAHPGPAGARVTLAVVLLLLPRLLLTLSLGRQAPSVDVLVPLHLSLGPQGHRGDIQLTKSPSLGPQGPRAGHDVLLPVSRSVWI